MKILFVCKYNVGRSQMASSLYNKLTDSRDSESAGTHVEEPGITLAQRKLSHPGKMYVIDVMKEIGLDVSKNICTQLTPELIEKYD